MWEYFIEVENEYIDYLIDLENKVKDKFNCITALVLNKLSIACDFKYKIKLESFLKKEIAELIIIIYKQLELEKMISLEYLPAELKSALIKCLTIFDYEEDLFFIINELELVHGINLFSFYNFKLKKIKKKWKQFASNCANNCNFIKSESFLDLLKFLIDFVTPRHRLVDVYFVDDRFLIIDEQNNVLSFNNDTNNLEVDLITNLITIAPQNINLHCAGVLTNNTFKVIYYIFNKKVNLLV